MPNYTFTEISAFEFEAICRDLLQAELGVALELFGAGPDGGIDIRYMGTTAGERPSVIAQCKRWAEGSFQRLLWQMEHTELPKIRRIAPKRYIVMSSARMTPNQKDTLMDALQPWVRSPADIFGRDDLTGLLARHTNIERRHIKLWLTSTEVLEALLNSAIALRSADAIEHAQRQCRLWVPNPSFDRARQILDTIKICVISGPPGIGKTMLADVLMTGYVTEGFQPVAISEDIEEGNRVWGSDKKQLFYYDDFLGRVTYGELHLAKNEESRLAHFIERVQRSRNKLLLLTTREYILAEAQMRYERMADLPTDRFSSVISMEDYTPVIRGKILYNHLYFTDLPEGLKTALNPGRKYWDVIRHRNYNPRVIEHAVRLPIARELAPTEFVLRLMHALDDPTAIWETIYENLPRMAQRILSTMASLPLSIPVEVLTDAVKSFTGEEWGVGVFNGALRTIEGTFIEIVQSNPGRSGPERVVRIRDASVRDFLWRRIFAVGGEFQTLLERATSFEQCVLLYEGRRYTNERLTIQDQGASKAMFYPVQIDADDVALKAITLINSSDPTAVKVSGMGQHKHVQKSAIIERRVAFLVDILADHGASDARTQIAARALKAVREKWDGGRGSLTDGVYLLSRVKLARNLLPVDLLRENGLALLGLIANQLDQTEVFKALVDLNELIPEIFSSPHREINSWSSEFRDHLDREGDWLMSDLDDPDLIEQELQELEEVAGELDVDISEFSAAVDERVAVLRMDAEEAMDSELWDGFAADVETQSEEKIVDEMFQSLLQDN